MHYIIGTSFQIPTRQQQTVRPSGIVSSATAGSTTANASREWADFEPGHTYSLYNIQKIDEGVLYTFECFTGGETIEKLFESTAAGDNYISRVLLEEVPDYGSFYENRND